jgi:hypothetical protein
MFVRVIIISNSHVNPLEDAWPMSHIHWQIV